jgi:signal peptidase II
MTAKRVVRALIILIILISTISCDQISKSIVRNRVDYNQSISLINNYLTLTKVENTGAFLSFGNKLPRLLSIILLIIIPIIVLGSFLFYLLTSVHLSNLKTLGIIFIIGGGIGNIYDRVLHGSVTDFLHMDLVIFQTGIFNIADVSIMTGGFILIVETLTINTKFKVGIFDSLFKK